MFPFDQNNQQQYQQYAQASDSGDYSQVDPDQAAGHVQQFAQNAPPEMQQQAYGQYFQQMPPCRIPGELRRCPLKLRGLSHEPCADPTLRAPYGPRRALPRLFPPIDTPHLSPPSVWIGAGFRRFSAGSAQG